MKKSRAVSNTAHPEGEKPSPFRIKLLGILLVLTAFLLPLKLGTLASMTEAAGFFPADRLDYWHITWPAHAFGIISGILLLLSCILTGGACGRKLPALFTGLWSGGILLAVLPGVFAPGAEANFAFVEFANFAGIAAWTLAVWHLHCAAPQWTKRMAAAFMTGALITAVNGYYQYFFGFAEMQEFVRKQLESGIQQGIRILHQQQRRRQSQGIEAIRAATQQIAAQPHQAHHHLGVPHWNIPLRCPCGFLLDVSLICAPSLLYLTVFT